MFRTSLVGDYNIKRHFLSVLFAHTDCLLGI